MFAWILVVAVVVFDIFRNRDLSKRSRVAWVLAVIVLPLVGLVGYLIISGRTVQGLRARAKAPD
jgi:Phospholipase_D-nuclease N-terminal